MFFTKTTFLGIDPTAGQRPFAYTALDADLHLLALGQGDMEEVLAFVAGQRQAVVAICSPRRPNQGLMRRGEVRDAISPAPRPGRWLDVRMAEYLLRQHNISIPQTLSEAGACPNWMKMGFSLYRRLESLGFHAYPDNGAELQCLEVYPHACYSVLLGHTPFPKYTLEGRLQRQLVLYEQKLAVPDPMRFFEEITSHRLLKGILPTENLYSPGELDALVAAFTAWLAAVKPEQVTVLGDPGEGQIVVPAAELKSHY